MSLANFILYNLFLNTHYYSVHVLNYAGKQFLLVIFPTRLTLRCPQQIDNLFGKIVVFTKYSALSLLCESYSSNVWFGVLLLN